MRRPGRPRPVTAFVAEGFFSRLSFGILTFALPLYAHRMGLSIAAIGVLLSLSAMVSLLLKPAMGVLADRIGLRRSLVTALALRSLLCLGYLVALVPWQLFAVRGVHGVSDSLRDPAVHALLAENGGKRTMASSFAWYQTAKTTAGAVGKSLAGVLLTVGAGGFAVTFGVAFVLSLLPALVVLLLVPTDRARMVGPGAVPVDGPPGPAEELAPVPAAPAGQRPLVLRYAGLGFLVSGASSMLTALFPLLATEYAGLTPAQAGLLYLVTPALAFTGPLWGMLSDRVSRSLVLSVRSVTNIGSALVYLAFPNVVGIWVGKSMDDLGKAAFRPAWGSLMADVAGQDKRRRARVMAYLTAGEDAGTIAAPILGGLLWSGFGVAALLLGRVALAALAEGYAVWLAHRPPPEEPGPPANPYAGTADELAGRPRGSR